jgi:2-iminobutanoate/2-iminopropanoate deaminase
MKKAISTDKAPNPGGPYSQAIVHNGIAYLAGQVSVEGDVEAQTEQVLQNIKAVLEASGSGLDKVLKTTVFLKDMNEFQRMNEVYARFFTTDPPARSTIEAARLPKDVRVEIDCIAAVD